MNQITPHLFIQDESTNVHGTIKDRRSKFIIDVALKNNVNHLALITSGNAGYSLAKLAQETNIKVTCIVDHTISPTIYNLLQDVCFQVIKLNLKEKLLTSFDIITLAQKNKTESIWDVSNGYHIAYIDIIREIKNTHPDYLMCPVGSGELFVGLYEGLITFNLNTTLIGLAPQKEHSFADKLHTSYRPYQKKLDTITTKKHTIFYLTEEEIKESFNSTKNILQCEPSSSIVWAGLNKINDIKNKTVVIINSGKGIV